MGRLVWVYITTVFILCVVMLAFSIKDEYTRSKQNLVVKEDINIEKEVEKDLQSDIISTVDIDNSIKSEEETKIVEKLEETEIQEEIKTEPRQLKDGEFYGESVYIHFSSHKDNILNGKVTFNVIIDENVKSYTSYDELQNDVKEKDIFTKEYELYENQTLKSYTFTRID